MSELTGIFGNFLDDAINVWNQRPGYRFAAKVEDQLKKIWGDNAPMHVEKPKKHDDYWRFLTTIPNKTTFNQFQQVTQQCLQDHVGGAVQITKQGTCALIICMIKEVGTNYPFTLDWASEEKYQKMIQPIPIGYSAQGLIIRDLARMVNILSAGHPDSGKTNWLKGVIGTVRRTSDTHVAVIDLKKSFGYLKRQIPVASTVARAEYVLEMFNREMDRRYELFEEHDVEAVDEVPGMKIPRCLLVIDELAEFSLLSKEAEVRLNRLARLGRQAAFSIIAATQRPSAGTLEKMGDTKAMFPASMAFRVRSDEDSGIILGKGNNRAKLLPPHPGRAIFAWDIEIEAQTMKFTKDDREPEIDNFDVLTKKDLMVYTQGGSWVDKGIRLLPAR